MSTVITGNPLDELFDPFPEEMTDRESDDRACPFRVRCAVIRGRPPRHEGFEFTREMGMAFIDPLLYGDPLTAPQTITLVFPERWMSVHEQQRFISQMCKHPQVAEIKCLDLVTSSPLIISSFIKEQVQICRWDDDAKYEGH